MTASAQNRAPSPRVVLCIKVDTLGDLVLFAPTLQALRSGLANTRIIALIRRGYADLAPYIAPGVEWIPTTLDPFAHGPGADGPELQRLRSVVSAIQPDVVVAATSRRNWLETVIAADCADARRIALGATDEDEFFATQLKIQLGIDARSAFTEFVNVEVNEPDWMRDLRIADTLLPRTAPRVRPTIAVGETLRASTEPFLSSHRLNRGHYVVCAAAGFANVPLKTWPAERYGAVLRHLYERHGLRAVLIGHESERTHLETVRACSGGEAVLWLGRDNSLPEMLALLTDAALFVGNDTGAMHLAAAVNVPVVAVFGGGTWPRFVPAARQAIAVVQPLPCFGCGWDCAFGDAPCIGGISEADVIAAVDRAMAKRDADFSEVQTVEHVSAETRAMMGKAAGQYRASRRDHLARQHKLEELTALDREKDAAFDKQDQEMIGKDGEISALKGVCDEREKTIFTLDGHVRNLQAHAATLEADKAVLEKTLRDLPPDQAAAARAAADQAVHIRNIEALLKIREQELSELRATAANHLAGRHDLEQAKHYSRLLAEKEAVIRSLRLGCAERDHAIAQLASETTSTTAKLLKLWRAGRAYTRQKITRPAREWLFQSLVEHYWMQIGVLRHYAPRPLCWDERLPGLRVPESALPKIGIVTPSYGQEKFIERTLRSVLDQHYPKLRYVVQDGGSKDRSAEIIASYADRLQHWESVKDNGQADAIARGFKHITEALGPDDVMAWLNSDDLFGPGVLRFVADYFARHPDVDVLYGHRIIIDDNDRDVGRWIMPRHNPETLEWIDYVPQETLFWRKKAWDLVGGIDPSFQFALDWDLLARFHQAGCKTVRVPYFLGAFRVHADQKTSQAIHTTGADEMRRIRTRFHGERQDDGETIERHARHARFWGAVTARLHEIGIRW